MKKINNNNAITVAIVFVLAAFASNIALAKQAGKEQILIEAGTPKKAGETLYSSTIQWRQGSDYIHRANGMTFMHGKSEVEGSKKPTTSAQSAKKIKIALNDSISYESPAERGIKVENNKGDTTVLISNKEGFDFVDATFRDYSNQKLTYSLPNTKFNSANIGLAIDLVNAVEVEYIVAITPDMIADVKDGWVKIQIDDDPAIEIKTDGKSAEKIEKEIANALSSKAKFSKTPIYPNYFEKDNRNFKKFDKGEVQLLGLSASSISIDLNDARYGVFVKFDYPDANKPTDVAGKVPYIVGLIVAVLLGFVFYITLIRDKNKGEDVS